MYLFPIVIFDIMFYNEYRGEAMNDFSKLILEKYQVRKSRKQKDDFIRLLKERYNTNIQIEETGRLKTRNIVIGDLKKAKLVLSAHYDTPAQLPIPNIVMPKSILGNVLYFMAIMLLMIVLEAFFEVFVSLLIANEFIRFLLNFTFLFFIIYLMLAGKANQHNANDNTSGVITLLEVYERLDDQQRNQVAFVFFDHEELGLVGSRQFAKSHKTELSGKPLMNFDCVASGDVIMLIVSRRLEEVHYQFLERSFQASKAKEVLVISDKGTYYPSDQMNFRTGIGVVALHRHRLFKYYLKDVHTNKDTKFDEENVELLVEGVLRWIACYDVGF